MPHNSRKFDHVLVEVSEDGYWTRDAVGSIALLRDYLGINNRKIVTLKEWLEMEKKGMTLNGLKD